MPTIKEGNVRSGRSSCFGKFGFPTEKKLPFALSTQREKESADWFVYLTRLLSSRFGDCALKNKKLPCYF